MHFNTQSHLISEAEVGGKYHSLVRFSETAIVPPAICLGVSELAAQCDQVVKQSIETFFSDFQVTFGAYAIESYPVLKEGLRQFRLSDEFREEIRRRIETRWPDLKKTPRSFAVRSSAVGEDAPNASFAGVYSSRLGLEDLPSMYAAVEECWRSYFSLPAISTRARLGDFSTAPRMAVIIQEFVKPQLAGVALSVGLSGGPEVEFCKGAAEGLVSGSTLGTHYLLDNFEQKDLPAEERDALSAVKKLLAKVHSVIGPADVEWAWACEELFLIQARPIANVADQGPTPSYCVVADLYADRLPTELRLGDCATVYGSYVQKRRWAMNCARNEGVKIGGAWIVNFPCNDVTAGANTISERLRIRSSKIVLDVNDSVRQLIVPTDELSKALRDTRSGGSSKTHTVILREFLQGDFGIISTVNAEGEVLVEFSPDGLLAINRGLAQCQCVLVSRSGDLKGNSEAAPGPVRKALLQIAEFTYKLSSLRPGIQAEWVIDEGLPVFVDYSDSTSPTLGEFSGLSKVISAGRAEGPLVIFDDSAFLQRLSIAPAVSVGGIGSVALESVEAKLMEVLASYARPPIIFCARPYAILAVLIGKVAGFVFREASVMCHLSLMLREARVPAVADALLQPTNGALAHIVDGLVWLEEESQ